MITKERLMEIAKKVTELTGDNEEVMTLLAEVTNDFEPTSSPSDEDVKDKDGVSWKVKYQNMREKYIDRFFNGSSGDNDPIDEPIDEELPKEEVKFEELFTDGE